MVSFALDSLFKIIIGVFAVAVIVFLLAKYSQVNINVPTNESYKGIQAITVSNEVDLIKSIYGCYSMSNFGENKNRVDCYILKIKKNIDWNIVIAGLNDLGISERAYEIKPLKDGDTALLYYENEKIRISII